MEGVVFLAADVSFAFEFAGIVKSNRERRWSCARSLERGSNDDAREK
jgi:hypothetical protein